MNLSDKIRNLLDEYLKDISYDKVLAITDSNVTLPTFDGIPTLTVTGGEDAKQLKVLEDIWRFLENSEASRASILLCIGGGSITDLGGFAAATFKRGIRHINIPTTLLGIVDASVGGKTGINFDRHKNEIGAFHLPIKVIFIPEFLETLPQEEIISGYGEILKTAILHSEKMIRDVITAGPDINNLPKLLPALMKVKEDIVKRDPLEKGERKTLNLGHTSGHAFESLAMRRGDRFPHGAAVAQGLVVELILAHILLDFPTQIMSAVITEIRSRFRPLFFSCDDYDFLLNAMNSDKKNPSHGRISFSLPESPGKCRFNIITQADIIKEALDICRDMLGI